MNDPVCPLCTGTKIQELFEIELRSFLECSNCDLLFAVPDSLLSHQEEKDRYLLHENSLENQGYVEHLSRLKDRLITKLSRGMSGLDFGCGPTPVLSKLLQRDGFSMHSYDPFYGPPLSPTESYDFITCTEAAEHFKSPISEFQLMRSIVKPLGWIAIMTNLREAERRSSNWWYLRDPSHRCFYSKKTFEIIASILALKIDSIVGDVILLQNQ